MTNWLINIFDDGNGSLFRMDQIDAIKIEYDKWHELTGNFRIMYTTLFNNDDDNGRIHFYEDRALVERILDLVKRNKAFFKIEKRTFDVYLNMDRIFILDFEKTWLEGQIRFFGGRNLNIQGLTIQETKMLSNEMKKYNIEKQDSLHSPKIDELKTYIDGLERSIMEKTLKIDRLETRIKELEEKEKERETQER